MNRRITTFLFALSTIFSGAAFAAKTTTTTLSISPKPSLLGQSVTLTGTVSNGTGGSTPTGAVTFFVGAIQLGSATLSGSGGTANYSFSTILLPASTKGSGSTNQLDVYAVYTGDGANSPSKSAIVHQTVTAKPGKGFDPGPNNPAVSSPEGVALGDFNGDGVMDLAVASLGASQVSILLGNGDGSFHQASGSPISLGNLGQIATVDFNEDSKLDIVVLTLSGATALAGNGDGTFSSQVNLTNPLTPPASEVPSGDTGIYYGGSSETNTALVTGDFDNDGHIDIGVVSANQGEIDKTSDNSFQNFLFEMFIEERVRR